jgi:hypothetical protein
VYVARGEVGGVGAVQSESLQITIKRTYFWQKLQKLPRITDNFPKSEKEHEKLKREEEKLARLAGLTQFSPNHNCQIYQKITKNTEKWIKRRKSGRGNYKNEEKDFNCYLWSRDTFACAQRKTTICHYSAL